MRKCGAKKMLTMILSLVIISSLMLAGCGGSNKSGNQESSSGANKDTGTKPKIMVSIYDRNNVPEGEGTITNNRWTKWINENSPVEVEFVSIPRTGSNSSIEKLNVMFASGKAPDLIMEYSNPFMKDLAGKGQIIPLDEPIEKYSTNYKKFLQENEMMKKLTTFNSQTYFFGRLTPFISNHYLMIRKDWLNKLNLPVPSTTEEFLKTAIAFAEQDPDGNGQKDTLGSTFYDIDYFFQLGQSSAESMPVTSYHLTNDEYVRTWDRPEAALKLKKQLYDAGAIDKDIFADKNGTKAQQDWVNGKLGIWGSDGLETAKGYGSYETFKKNNPDAEVVILPLPKSEFGQFAPAGGTPMQFTAAINATTKNVEAVIQYVDWLMSESTQKTLMYGFEGEHYKMGDNGCPVAIDIEKNKKELIWNSDYQMLTNTGAMGNCVDYANQLDPNKPLDKEYIELIKEGREAYISPDRPYTIEVVLPVSLKDDLLVINSTVTNTIISIYTKAVVSGTSYTVEQAMKDAKSAWEKAGGTKIDDFYAKAYQDNKNDIIYTKDYYQYLNK